MKKNLLRIISFLSLIFFFFPFYAISWDYKKTSYSALDLAIGHDMSPYSTGYPFVFLLLFIPLAFLAISFYSKKRERIAALAASTSGVIILLAVSVIAGTAAKKQGFELTTKSGFFLYLLTLIASILFILYEFLIENPVSETPTNYIIGGSFIKSEPPLPQVDMEERMLQLSKIRNLYDNKIFSTEEFHIKKSIWIGSLNYYGFDGLEMDFLSELLPYVTDCIISPEELDKIKYLISQECADLRQKTTLEEKHCEEDLARSKRQELVNDVKSKTKDGINGVISRLNGTISSIEKGLKGPLCECGKPLPNDSVFCKNCGKKAGTKPADSVISNSVQRKKQRNSSLQNHGSRNDRDALIHENIQDSINILSRCGCGESIDPTMIFCTNCGKQNP